METKYFNFSDVLGFGWRVMKANFWFFVGVGIIYGIVNQLPNIISRAIRLLPLPKSVGLPLIILFTAAGWVIGIVVAIGLIKIALAFCDQQRPRVGTLFDAMGCFWRYVGAMILYTLIMLAGFILLFIPGIIWAVKFSLCYYFVIDKGLDPIEALKASSRTTMGVKWQLFGFGILCGLINLLGLICLILGVFATYPTVLVATALVYRQLMAQTPELAEFAIPGPQHQIEPAPLPDQQQ